MPYGQRRTSPTALVELIPLFEHQLKHCRLKEGERLVAVTDATFDPADLDVAINGVWVCKQSTPHADPATVDLKQREVSVTIDLKSWFERATVWTNDLTHAYVHENSAYSS